MQVFIAQVINGLSLGSIYVLLVTGFNLLLLVAMIIHFSYPAGGGVFHVHHLGRAAG